jgi:maltose O-acetyltransferase
MKLKKREIRIIQLFCLIIYYALLRHLPSSASSFGGPIWRWVRYQCCKHIFLECGRHVNIERGAYFASGVRLRIGDESGLGIRCHVPADVVIGKHVMMGPNCHILGANHAFTRVDIPMILQGFEDPRQTVIEDDVWIGRDVIFTPGRHVKFGTVVAAGCVLSKDFPPYSIVGGNPARLVRNRGELHQACARTPSTGSENEPR